MKKYNAVSAVVDAAAAYRVTKLIIDDEILREPRENLLDQLEDMDTPTSRKLAYFLSCPWCVSIYAGLGIVALRKLFPNAAELINSALAFSAVTGYTEEHS